MRKYKYLLILFLLFLVACNTEKHQTNAPSRATQPTDAIIVTKINATSTVFPTDSISISTDIPSMTNTATVTPILLTPSLWPTVPFITTPNADQLARWQEYERVLAEEFMSHYIPENVLCEWVFLGQSGQEVYVWVSCQSAVPNINDRYAGISAPGVIYLGIDGFVQDARKVVAWPDDIHNLFPPDIQEVILSREIEPQIRQMFEHITYRRENPVVEEVEGPLGNRWIEVSSNPVLVPPTCPAWNCLGMTDPWLGRQPDGTRVLWVSAGGDAAEGGPVLGRATHATDGTFRFSSSAPELTPADNSWDRWRETVSLTYNETREQWSIWYLGYRESFFEDPAIGRAVSDGPEGLQFSRPDAPIYRPSSDSWDALFITDPVPIRMPNGRWHLYYVGAGSTVGVGLLISEDGESWTPHPQNPVFERDLEGWDQGLLGIEVKYVGDRFYMWYTGYEEPLDLETTPMSIGQAESVNGIHWSRSASNPVIEPGPPGAWNGLRVVSPSVIVNPDGTLTMAVHGQSREDARGGSFGSIGLYELQSGGH